MDRSRPAWLLANWCTGNPKCFTSGSVSSSRTADTWRDAATGLTWMYISNDHCDVIRSASLVGGLYQPYTCDFRRTGVPHY